MNENRATSAMKILVVEDSRTQAEYLRHILEKVGHRVVLAADGSEAMEQLAIDRPGLVLTDIVMPGIDGYELCRRIKQDERTADIPVILVTQLYDPADVMRGLESGADGFIIKPYEPGYIHSRIDAIIAAMGRKDSSADGAGLEVPFSGKTYTIRASRFQILNTLLSTYEIAVKKNSELQEAQERLNSMNEQLQQAVGDLQHANAELNQEIIERRRVEKALADANKKLQLMASITRHDLQNQLMALQGYLELAQLSREKDPAKAWDHIASAASLVNQTQNTIRFTAEYQKIGVNSPAWLDVRTLVDKAQTDVPLSGVRLENLLPEGLMIYADPLIEKVFANLIENAVRYGEKITTIRFRFDEGGGVATIVCEDDGMGIPAPEKEKIFTYQYGRNTGLGLFLAREILAITGITIRETGVPGSGARFEILCPKERVRRSGRLTG